MGRFFMKGHEVHRFILPIPPSANVIWKNRKIGNKPYINPIYDKWLKDCALLAPRIKHHKFKKWDLHVEFYFYYVHKIANMDVDNRLKPLIDFLKEIIKIDDRWLQKGSWERFDLKSPHRRSDHYCRITVVIY